MLMLMRGRGLLLSLVSYQVDGNSCSEEDVAQSHAVRWKRVEAIHTQYRHVSVHNGIRCWVFGAACTDVMYIESD